MSPPTVFISYSSADRLPALEVRRLLESRGCEVWLDGFDLRGTAKADVLCLLLSPSAVASPWVAEEVARGREQTAARGARTVAVLLRPCRPPEGLVGKELLDATTGLSSPDVRARLARAVLGPSVVDDAELDAATREALLARQAGEREATAELPRFARQLDAVRDQPIRKLHIAFQPAALPPRAVLAVSLTCEPLFSRPMCLRFAHYREGRTWPSWMRLDEPGRDEVRGDGKRVVGRLEWSKKPRALPEELDGSDLRDGPAAFTLELSGDEEIPSLSSLIARGASFGVALRAEPDGAAQEVAPEENDLELRVTALYQSGPQVTLFRSNHRPLERQVLEGAYLSSHGSAIEREAILGVYPRATELAKAEARQRRERAQSLLAVPEEALSPDERRSVATLRHGEAQLLVSRVFGNAPPPGPARRKLHAEATEACEAILRLLSPLVAAEPGFHDVGMAYWAASNLALYHETVRAPERARQYGETALRIVEEAAARAPDEPEFGRWAASARERLRRAAR